MEFWGIEVKPGQIVKCEAGDERILHLSQASLGESKKEKGTENVPIFIKVNDQKLVIGTLSADKCAQIQYDLVFEKDFELSHGSKNTSVYFAGYKRVNESDEPEDVFDDSSSEDNLEIDEKANGKPSKNEQGKSTTEKASAGKDGNVAAKLKAKMEKLKKEQVKADNKVEDKDVEDDSDEDEDDSEEDLTCKPSKNEQGKSTTEKASSAGKDGNVAAKLKANIEKLKKEQVKADNMVEDKDVDDDSDEDEDDSEEDSDEDIVESPGDSSEEDEDDSSEEEDTPEKVETDKKRKADSASKTPIPEKKARVVTPAGNHRTGGDGKKVHVHVATPHPAKQGGKPQQFSKSCGSVTCKSCNRAFNSENALQAHRKDKHGNAAK